jgi:hypothetical protein
MKLYLFFPLTYLAGVQGFAMFASYLCVFLAAAHLVRWYKAN